MIYNNADYRAVSACENARLAGYDDNSSIECCRCYKDAEYEIGGLFYCEVHAHAVLNEEFDYKYDIKEKANILRLEVIRLQ